MIDPWADEEIKRLSASYWDGIAGDETSVSRCEAATSLRAAYERGKADAQTEIEKLFKLNQETANNYAKMREVLEKIGQQKKTEELENSFDVELTDFEQGYDDSIDIARTILKEIDNVT